MLEKEIFKLNGTFKTEVSAWVKIIK
jgi:hypothetical protein